MTSKVARNAPCPCGSGKKHKQCCLGKEPPAARRRFWVGVGLALIVTGVAVGMAYYYSSMKNAFFTGLGGVILIMGFSILRKAPAPTGRSGSSRIDFGK